MLYNDQQMLYSRNKHIIRDVIEMSAVLEPGSGRGDVVCGTLALHFDQDREVGEVFAVPLVERSQEV